jgi:hypothetical protein
MKYGINFVFFGYYDCEDEGMGNGNMGIFVGLWIAGLLWCLSNLILCPRKLSYKRQFDREAGSKKFDKEAYQKADKYSFQLKSDFGYILSCELIKPDPSKENGKYKKIAVLCHGLGCAKCSGYKYAELFLRLGYHVLLYDQRNHGQSGRALTSMGFYERLDLKKVIDWCFCTYGKEIRIVTHGESMGAATVLMHLGIDDRVTCTIADCAYSDLITLVKHQVKQYYHLPSFLIPVISFVTYLRAGFWYHDISPIKVVGKTETPILFIHGKIDNFVPTAMSKYMYACKRKDKAIYLVARAKHAQSIVVNRKGYEKRVTDFVSRYLEL